MVRLIVLDQLRQMRGAYLMIGWLVVAVWLGLAGGPRDMSLLVALSILWACVAGPMVTFTNLARKEFTVLPVSRRQLWRARWLLGTVIPVAVTATGAAVVLAMAPLIPVGGQAHLDLFVLAALCEFAYLGVISGLLVLLSRRRSRLSPRVDGVIDGFAIAALLGGFFGGEFLIRPYLPVRWADLRGFTAVVLAAGVALAVASYFYSPGTGGRAFTRRASKAQRPTAATSSLGRLSRPTSGLVSILRLVLAWSAMTSLVFSALLPFFNGDKESHTVVWFIMAMVITRAPWRARLRQLRMLPLSTWQLNAILLGSPAAMWLSVGTTLTLLHVVFPGRAADVFRPELIAGLIGVSALADTFDLQSRWVKGALVALALVLIGVNARYLDHAPATAVWSASSWFGLAAISVAGLLNHHALTRSSSIYEPEKSALSFARL